MAKSDTDAQNAQDAQTSKPKKPKEFDRCYARKDPDNRGHLVMCRGIPDLKDPDKPSKDNHKGEVIFSMPRREFWAEALALDYCWVAEGFGGFDKFWRHDPARAIRVRNDSAFANQK